MKISLRACDPTGGVRNADRRVSRACWVVVFSGMLGSALLHAGQAPPGYYVRPGETVQSALLKLAGASTTPIGFEEAGPDTPRVALKRTLDLSRMAPEKALPLLLGNDAPYHWVRQGGAITIRPAHPTGTPRTSFLDRRVDLDLRDVTLRDVAMELRNSFVRLRSPDPHETRVPPLWSRRFAASGKGTIADVLTAVIVTHREAVWAVSYESVDRNDTPSVKLTFLMFDRSSFGMEIARPGSIISR